jgi:hypothetical protein
MALVSNLPLYLKGRIALVLNNTKFESFSWTGNKETARGILYHAHPRCNVISKVNKYTFFLFTNIYIYKQ